MAELAPGISTNWGLLELDLSNSRFGARLGLLGTNGTKYLATCLRGNKTLQTLLLVGSLQTSDEGAEVAAAVGSCTSLLSIDISNSTVGASGVKKLVAALALCPRIVGVFADENVLEPLLKARKVFRAIQELTADETVALNLDGCIDITSAEPAALLFALDQNVSLESLSIQQTLLGPENMRDLMKIVSRSPRLTTLNISHCFTTDEEEALDLAEFLQTNATLTCLSVRGMTFTGSAMKALTAAFKRNDALTKLRIDRPADVLQPFAYFNDEMGRIKNADPEDLNDLLFEAIRLDKSHRVQALLDAGADASARSRTSGQLSHGILLASDESADSSLLALFRAHFEIDIRMSKLFLRNERARAVFKRLVLALVHEGWRCPSTGDNVMHCILKACMEELISSEHAESLCKFVQAKRPSILEQLNDAGLSPVEIATQCSRGLRLLFADSIVQMVQTWTRASLDGVAAPGDVLRRSFSMPSAAAAQRTGSDDSFVVVSRSIGNVDAFRRADRASSPALGRPGFHDPRLATLPSTSNASEGTSSPKPHFDATVVTELRNEITVLQEQVINLLEANRMLVAENAELRGSPSNSAAAAAVPATIVSVGGVGSSKYQYPAVAADDGEAYIAGNTSSKSSARRLFGARVEDKFPTTTFGTGLGLGASATAKALSTRDADESGELLANPLSPSTPDGHDVRATEDLAAVRMPAIDLVSPLPQMGTLADLDASFESPATWLKSRDGQQQRHEESPDPPTARDGGNVDGKGGGAEGAYAAEAEVEAEEFVYESTTYFLERCTGKVYQRRGDNAFVGKMMYGVLNFSAVDSDEEEEDAEEDEEEEDHVTSM